MDLAVIDTSVVILLLSQPGLEDEPTRVRRERAELRFETLAKSHATFAIPTPVIAELCRGGPGSAVYEALLKAIKKRVRTLPLTVGAADIAGAARRSFIKTKVAGDERGAVNYDALIFGIASHFGARWILTANPRDYERLCRDMRSAIEVINTDAIPSKGQLHLVHQQAPTAPPAASATRKKSKSSRKT